MCNQTYSTSASSPSTSNKKVNLKNQQYAAILLLEQQPRKDIQKNTTLIAKLNWMRSFEAVLCSQIDQRKQFQKMEFLTNWALLCLLAVGESHTVFNIISSHIHTAALLYIKASIFTRIVAYAIDFANARKKLGKLPSWLILHHVGVLASHITVAFYFSRTYFKAMLYLFCIQSTHNTWTKKYSLFLYWGNVLLGMMASIYASFMTAVQSEVSLSLGLYICMLVSLLTAITGVGLLVVDCYKGKKVMKKKSSNH